MENTDTAEIAESTRLSMDSHTETPSDVAMETLEDPTLPSFLEPNIVEESSFADPDPEPTDEPQHTVETTWEVVGGGTKRGGDKLVNNIL